jgi:2-amino-4-hydroxy-6-hydroxymethyldihydropteridine diphosphokinase
MIASSVIDAVVGLGANLGEPPATFASALAMIEATPGLELIARSRLYHTPPLGPPQPDYENAAIRLRAAMEPEALLDVLLAVERAHGRDRDVERRWGPRTLDLDLLYVFGRRIDTERLHVPHPGLTTRAFALAPLLDVAAELAPRFEAALAAAGGAPPSRSW